MLELLSHILATGSGSGGLPLLASVGEAQPQAEPLRSGNADNLSFVVGDNRIVVAAVTDPGTAPVQDIVYDVYDRILGYISRSGFRYLWRTWNIMPQLECYEKFNQGRARAYHRHGIKVNFYPAATVLSSHGSNFTVYAMAGSEPAICLENRRQRSACRYPVDDGCQPPQFSRAVVVPWDDGEKRMLLSGTASIVGHSSMHPGCLMSQFDETMLNAGTMAAISQMPEARHVNLYLSGDSLPPHLLEVARKSFPGAVLRFCQAGFCRPELLLEIDGVWA